LLLGANSETGSYPTGSEGTAFTLTVAISGLKKKIEFQLDFGQTHWASESDDWRTPF